MTNTLLSIHFWIMWDWSLHWFWCHMCAGRRTNTLWLRWEPHMLFRWTNKDHMTQTSWGKERVGRHFAQENPQEGLSVRFEVDSNQNKLTFNLRFQHHSWEIKKKPQLPFLVLFLSLQSFSPKARHFSNSPWIVLVALIKNHFKFDATIRVSSSQIFMLIRFLAGFGRKNGAFLHPNRPRLH